MNMPRPWAPDRLCFALLSARFARPVVADRLAARLDMRLTMSDKRRGGYWNTKKGDVITEFEAATLALQPLTLLVGAVQVGAVAWGIRALTRLGERREQQHAERHAGTMEAQRQQGVALPCPP